MTAFLVLTPRNLTLAGSIDGAVAHLVGWVPGYPGLTGGLTSSLCQGAGVWTQSELDSQLSVCPRLSTRPRCGRPGCAQMWQVYDAIPQHVRDGDSRLP